MAMKQHLALCLHQCLQELLSNEQMMAPLLPIFHHYTTEKRFINSVSIMKSYAGKFIKILIERMETYVLDLLKINFVKTAYINTTNHMV